jgi:lipid-binding SYLF domain-containing protein
LVATSFSQENSMKSMNGNRMTHTAVIGMLALFAGAVDAQTAAPPNGEQVADTSSSAERQEARAGTYVTDASAVVLDLAGDPRMHPLLQRSKGVFIVPSYGRVALGVGASGGTGLLLARRADGTGSNPAFYNTGGLNVGLQVGAEGGAVAFLLMNDKAVREFTKKNNFSLNAKAGLTILNWTRLAQSSAGTGDIVAWSGTKGLFGDLATIELNDVRFNQKLTNAYYKRSLSVSDVIAGKASNTQADPLMKELVAAATR